MKLNHILGLPQYVEGVGEIHPVLIKEYDSFQECSYPLYYSKAHFKGMDEYPLLDLIVFGTGDNKITSNLENLFSLVLRKQVYFDSTDTHYGFVIEEDKAISSSNYDLIRTVIMKQNILFEQKVYDNPLVQQWAEKVMKAKSKNAAKIGAEEMLSTVSVFKGASYDTLAEQTYYQLYADFLRINKFKAYDTSIQTALTVGSKDVKIENFAEEVNMYNNPYDDLFVSSGKLNDLNNAMK
ncbi:hypothetical protein [Brevibacillus sp. NRS-1366]|uniref:hypothetical protein n=1 Tax=Brevibacillus sp. NRS-1366 TaxID=3233899 RepID=UPI003D1EDFCD